VSAKGAKNRLAFEVETFENDLGWGALAHDGQSLLQMVIGLATERAATGDLREAMRRSNATTLTASLSRRESQIDQPAFDADAFIERLAGYAAGRPDDFADVPLAEGDPNSFRCRVLAACRRIPRGKTMSYGELAARAGSPGAARAVGSAMATNCVPLVVPCHRVVGAAGRLGGFSAHGGLTLKRRLLELEGAIGHRSESMTPGGQPGNKSAWNKLRVSARIRPRAGNSDR
jgi:methylated-DNA-[protein]-cysteine S-methyltransferase